MPVMSFSSLTRKQVHSCLVQMQTTSLDEECLKQLGKYFEKLGGKLEDGWSCRAQIRDYGSRAGSVDTWFTGPDGTVYRSKIAAARGAGLNPITRKSRTSSTTADTKETKKKRDAQRKKGTKDDKGKDASTDKSKSVKPAKESKKSGSSKSTSKDSPKDKKNSRNNNNKKGGNAKGTVSERDVLRLLTANASAGKPADLSMEELAELLMSMPSAEDTDDCYEGLLFYKEAHETAVARAISTEKDPAPALADVGSRQQNEIPQLSNCGIANGIDHMQTKDDVEMNAVKIDCDILVSDGEDIAGQQQDIDTDINGDSVALQHGQMSVEANHVYPGSDTDTKEGLPEEESDRKDAIPSVDVTETTVKRADDDALLQEEVGKSCLIAPSDRSNDDVQTKLSIPSNARSVGQNCGSDGDPKSKRPGSISEQQCIGTNADGDGTSLESYAPKGLTPWSTEIEVIRKCFVKIPQRIGRQSEDEPEPLSPESRREVYSSALLDMSKQHDCSEVCEDNCEESNGTLRNMRRLPSNAPSDLLKYTFINEYAEGEEYESESHVIRPAAWSRRRLMFDRIGRDNDTLELHPTTLFWMRYEEMIAERQARDQARRAAAAAARREERKAAKLAAQKETNETMDGDRKEPSGKQQSSMMMKSSSASSLRGRSIEEIESILLERLTSYIADLGGVLPKGWRIKASIRQNGANAGGVDTYYYDPEGRRHKSMIKVAEFLGLDTSTAVAKPKSLASILGAAERVSEDNQNANAAKEKNLVASASASGAASSGDLKSKKNDEHKDKEEKKKSAKAKKSSAPRRPKASEGDAKKKENSEITSPEKRKRNVKETSRSKKQSKEEKTQPNTKKAAKRRKQPPAPVPQKPYNIRARKPKRNSRYFQDEADTLEIERALNAGKRSRRRSAPSPPPRKLTARQLSRLERLKREAEGKKAHKQRLQEELRRQKEEKRHAADDVAASVNAAAEKKKKPGSTKRVKLADNTYERDALRIGDPSSDRLIDADTEVEKDLGHNADAERASDEEGPSNVPKAMKVDAIDLIGPSLEALQHEDKETSLHMALEDARAVLPAEEPFVNDQGDDVDFSSGVDQGGDYVAPDLDRPVADGWLQEDPCPDAKEKMDVRVEASNMPFTAHGDAREPEEPMPANATEQAENEDDHIHGKAASLVCGQALALSEKKMEHQNEIENPFVIPSFENSIGDGDILRLRGGTSVGATSVPADESSKGVSSTQNGVRKRRASSFPQDSSAQKRRRSTKHASTSSSIRKNVSESKGNGRGSHAGPSKKDGRKAKTAPKKTTTKLKGGEKGNDKVVKGTEGSKDGKPKKSKKNPAQKRAPSAFIMFLKETRPKIKAEHPGITFADIGRRLGEAWRTITEEERKRYESLAKEASEKMGCCSSDNKKTKRKQAPTAFLLYAKDTRPKLKAENPEITFADIGRRLGEGWKDMPEEERKSYEEKAKQAAKEFRAEQRKLKDGVVRNVYDRAYNRLRGQLGRLRQEQALVEAYAADGWRGASREKVKPLAEIKRAKEQILRCKESVRECVKVCDEVEGDKPISPDLYDSEGELDMEHIVCSKCGVNESTDDNDIVMCDADWCHLAYHFKCLVPPLDPSSLSEDEAWLCPSCDRKIDMIDIINDEFGTNYEYHQSWEEILRPGEPLPLSPRATAEGAVGGGGGGALFNADLQAADGSGRGHVDLNRLDLLLNDVELPSEDEEDEDYDVSVSIESRSDVEHEAAAVEEEEDDDDDTKVRVGSDGDTGIEKAGGVDTQSNEVEEDEAMSSGDAGSGLSTEDSSSIGSLASEHLEGEIEDVDIHGLNEIANKLVNGVAVDNAKGSASDTNSAEILTGKRRRRAVDYKALHLEMFGDLGSPTGRAGADGEEEEDVWSPKNKMVGGNEREEQKSVSNSSSSSSSSSSGSDSRKTDNGSDHAIDSVSKAESDITEQTASVHSE